MILPDVNILVYAHSERAVDHHRFKDWVEGLIQGNEAYGISDLVLSGFLRIVTNPRIFTPPSAISDALAFADRIRNQPHCVVVAPGQRHWDLFTGLCRTAGARGNLIPDAYLAALAIESGSEWITTDGDYARFPGLRWRYPFA
jgi:toxin-antitoxin system PIN domain toxin